MNVPTPQFVRSLLRAVPKALHQSRTAIQSRAFVCSQCRSRGISGSSGQLSRRPHTSAIANDHWRRQWSSSAIRGQADEKDKPAANVFHMPPPDSHVERTTRPESTSPASSAGNEEQKPVESDKAAEPASIESESVATPPPSPLDSPTAEPAEKAAEKPSDFIPDIPPTRPYPVEEVPDAEPRSDPTITSQSTNAPASEPETPKYEESASSFAFAKYSSKLLPSESEKERWQLSKNTQKWMDNFLAKAAIFSQQLNTYTGTDYSGIEALRREIIEQERMVKRMHATIATAKEAYTQAHAAQTASQKEVVGLLERKHSWTAGDLERYMSLIRSEHLNEQAVQRAKDDLAAAERSLEDARSELERKERKQYHEEQIWSDTIRRNSTWVTFGLMGLNIFLLLANLAIIEPWRRSRLVKEVRAALEENAQATSASITAATAAAPAAAATAARQAVEADIDKVVEPSGTKIEEVEKGVVEAVTESAQAADEVEAVSPVALAAGMLLPEEALEIIPNEIPKTTAEALSETPKQAEPETLQGKVEERWGYWKAVVQDLFSDRPVTVKKVDMTTVALESAAAGIAVMGFLILLFNPR